MLVSHIMYLWQQITRLFTIRDISKETWAVWDWRAFPLYSISHLMDRTVKALGLILSYLELIQIFVWLHLTWLLSSNQGEIKLAPVSLTLLRQLWKNKSSTAWYFSTHILNNIFQYVSPLIAAYRLWTCLLSKPLSDRYSWLS